MGRVVMLAIELDEDAYNYVKSLQYVNIGRVTTKTIQSHVINAIKCATPLYEGDCLYCKHYKDWSQEGLCRCGACIETKYRSNFEPGE